MPFAVVTYRPIQSSKHYFRNTSFSKLAAVMAASSLSEISHPTQKKTLSLVVNVIVAGTDSNLQYLPFLAA